MTDQWKGKTAYPRDVATKRHVDRVQDRLDRRVDLHGDKVERLKSHVSDLEKQIRDLTVLVTACLELSSEEKKQS